MRKNISIFDYFGEEEVRVSEFGSGTRKSEEFIDWSIGYIRHHYNETTDRRGNILFYRTHKGRIASYVVVEIFENIK